MTTINTMRPPTRERLAFWMIYGGGTAFILNAVIAVVLTWNNPGHAPGPTLNIVGSSTLLAAAAVVFGGVWILMRSDKR